MSVEPTGPVTACKPGEHDLSDGEVAADLDLLSAVSSETRYEALRLIATAEDGRCVCEIEPALGVSQSAVSQALSRLHASGLVTRRKEGRWRYYEVTPRARRLVSVLDETRGGVDA
jgi:ArsR family transcriptional regulator